MTARGFTLIELLVALAIFALMAAMAYGGLRSVLDTKAQVDTTLAHELTLHAAMYRIETDLEQAVRRPIRDQFGDFKPALLGRAKHGLAFTRNGWPNPLREKRSHLQRVAYHLNDDDELVRWHWRELDRAQDSLPVKTVLLKHVKHVEWRFADSAGTWHDRWPPQQPDTASVAVSNASDRLPQMVELRLDTKRYGELTHLFMMPGAQPTDTNQSKP